MWEILALLAAVAVGWFWLDTLKAREIALAAGERACEAEGFQFLDWTVAQARLRVDRDDAGHAKLRRVYDFEYSATGADRYRGSVTLLGREVLAVHLAAPPSRPDNVVNLR